MKYIFLILFGISYFLEGRVKFANLRGYVINHMLQHVRCIKARNDIAPAYISNHVKQKSTVHCNWFVECYLQRYT